MMGQSLAVARATPECYEQTFMLAGSCCGCGRAAIIKVGLISAALRAEEHHQVILLDWLVESPSTKWKLHSMTIRIIQKCLFTRQLVEETVHTQSVSVDRLKDPVRVPVPADFCPALSCSLCSIWTELEASLNDGQVLFRTRLKLT
jgi:hypothetical protein